MIPKLPPFIGALDNRRLTAKTISRWGLSLHGTALAFPYFNDHSDLVAHKCRTKDKDFFVTGDLKSAQLFGQNLWRDGGRRVIVTEGEFDAMSVDQALDYRWPVVSVPNGAAGARKALAKQIAWLEQFETVVLCFDQDEAGQEAVQECVGLFKPGRVAIAKLPLKDASDMLQAGRSKELVNALWDAKGYRPDGIITAADVLDKVIIPPSSDMSWFLPTLNELTIGRRYGELVTVGAGTGAGKSTLIAGQIAHDLNVLGLPVGVFSFEQAPAETVKRVIGQIDGKTYYIPDTGWTQDELVASVKKFAEGTPLYLYDHHGANDWEVVRERIRYLHHAHGVRIFYIDNLTALVGGEKEREAIEVIMKELGGLIQELSLWVCLISHLATREGKSHEEGGQVSAKHFKGSRNIAFWSSFMFGIERDQQAPTDEERAATTLRVLKDRYTGRSNGHTIALTFQDNTGRLVEAGSMPPIEEGPAPF